ncbi:DMT family transporter [Celeribacter neptunius]|uniref:S-adenosylmethionine uptake transporter n=1 Tax=Celeribacter neptunius TaxID=588602 RepID=A0A1I3Y803_9RHOB|nr:DMT family transporter [Celeribacter neptunius]SFK27401.1 S-adenosylmethionine uptake transporter [Celeribacter neptunius]
MKFSPMNFFHGLPENTRGAMLMALSMAAFTTNDSFMKGVLAEVPLFQALFLRASLNLVMLFAVLAPLIGPVRFDLSRRDWGFVTVRSLAEVGAAMCFLSAVSHMPLANATAIMQTMPLSITVAGWLLFRDPLGWRRLVAIGVGFCGVLLIVQPGTEGFSAYALLAVLAMLCVTCRDIIVRKMHESVPNATVTFGAILAVWLATGLLSMGQGWAPVPVKAWAQLLGSASFLIVGYVTSVAVMRVGEMSFVSPFRYTALVWALLIGLLAFGEWPNTLALVGAVVIAGTGIYTVLREARLRRRG